MNIICPPYPVETMFMLIGDKWKVLILRDLMDGTKRFVDRKRQPKGAHITAAGYGSEGLAFAKSLCGSAAQS